MQGLFGVISDDHCSEHIYKGICAMYDGCGGDYGGIATHDGQTVHIQTHHGSFRETLKSDLEELKGNFGIGVNSKIDRQPIKRWSRLGKFAVGAEIILNNVYSLQEMLRAAGYIFSSEDPVEVVAVLIGKDLFFEDGIKNVLVNSTGSCRIIVLSQNGIYAARSRDGSRPLYLGKSADGIYAVSTETRAFRPLHVRKVREVKTGEIVLVNNKGFHEVSRIKAIP